VAIIPQANYTDWPTAAGRRILVPTFADRRVSRGQGGYLGPVHNAYDKEIVTKNKSMK
jgi:hypothetical protein